MTRDGPSLYEVIISYYLYSVCLLSFVCVYSLIFISTSIVVPFDAIIPEQYTILLTRSSSPIVVDLKSDLTISKSYY